MQYIHLNSHFTLFCKRSLNSAWVQNDSSLGQGNTVTSFKRFLLLQFCTMSFICTMSFLKSDLLALVHSPEYFGDETPCTLLWCQCLITATSLFVCVVGEVTSSSSFSTSTTTTTSESEPHLSYVWNALTKVCPLSVTVTAN